MNDAMGRERGRLGILLCPRCNQAFISESREIVEVLLAVHIESCEYPVSFGLEASQEE